jgi:hypothetical protein
MFDNRVTRFGSQVNAGGGVNGDYDNGFLSDLGIPSPFGYHIYPNDFDTYAAGDWTTTKVGTGTVALTAANGGVLALTNTTGTSDSISMQLVNASFQLASGFRCWGRYIAKVSSTLPNLILGLANTTTTPFSGFTDGIWLSSSGTALTMNILANSGTPQTLVATPTLVAGSYFTFMWYYDGECYNQPLGRVVFQLSGAGVSANWRGEIICSTTFPFTTLLAPQIAFQNTTALASVLSLDQMAILEDRTNINGTNAF